MSVELRTAGELAEDTGRAADEDIGRAMVRGMIIGLVVVVPFATAIGMLSGTGVMGAVGIGVFCGFWGGPGFGMMFGPTLAMVAEEKQQRRAAAAAAGGVNQPEPHASE